MPEDQIQQMVKEISTLLLKINTPEELELFLDGILTPAEIESFAMRWKLLQLLAEGLPQREIQSRLGICLGKVSRGSRVIKYGKPGFKELVQKLSENKE